MKKFLSLTVAAVLALSALTSCGGDVQVKEINGVDDLPGAVPDDQGADGPLEDGGAELLRADKGIGCGKLFDHLVVGLGCDGYSGIYNWHKKSPPGILCPGGGFGS